MSCINTNWDNHDFTAGTGLSPAGIIGLAQPNTPLTFKSMTLTPLICYIFIERCAYPPIQAKMTADLHYRSMSP